MGSIPYIFFGTGEIAAGALSELEKSDLTPSFIVTSPDKPSGRGRALTPSAVAQWARARSIEILQPKKLDPDFLSLLRVRSTQLSAHAFIVVDYGKILPRKLLEIPARGVLNMHPSLLPRLRGPSPIRSAILNDEKNTGVSVMLVNEKLDEGPLIAQRPVSIPDWPPRGRELDAILSSAGGKLLAEVLPLWLRGEIEAHEQRHDRATYSTMFEKSDGLLDLVHGDPYQNLLRIRAFDGWPGTYTFFERGKARVRVQILEAHLEKGRLVIDLVKPEGKSEMSYKDFTNSGARAL